jgi:hypothetical protein
MIALYWKKRAAHKNQWLGYFAPSAAAASGPQLMRASLIALGPGLT